jgi:hypothetical protein
MCRHHEVRQHRLRGSFPRQRFQFAHDAVGAEPGQQLELSRARRFRPLVRQVDDLALRRSVDRRVGLIDEARQVFRMPVVAARLPLVAVHALLHDGPLAVVGDEEAVQVEVETVLHRGAVDLGDQTARARQPGAVEADALAEQPQLIGRFPGVPAAAAADMDSQFVLQRPEAALQRADHAGRDAGRVPVHAHHGAERLKPERMRQPLQEFVAAVMVHDGLRDDGAERGHARRQPWRNASAMEREVGAAGTSCHSIPVDCGNR